MRKRKVHAQAVKRIMRPEVSHCLECQRRLQRCVTISQGETSEDTSRSGKGLVALCNPACGDF